MKVGEVDGGYVEINLVEILIGHTSVLKLLEVGVISTALTVENTFRFITDLPACQEEAKNGRCARAFAIMDDGDAIALPGDVQ